MVDIVSKDVRSKMMSGIRSKNTKPELILRKNLHRKGFRYRLHEKSLPGKPDLVFPKHNAVIFVNGCFWHGHDCHLFKWPRTRADFWKQKIGGNVDRDHRQQIKLEQSGWRICVVWECAIKGKLRLPIDLLVLNCSNWLYGIENKLEIVGK